MLRSTIVAIALPLAACASSPKPASTPVAPEPAAAPAADTSVFSLVELTIYDKTGAVAMRLHPDGRYELKIGFDDAGKDVWRDIGTFTADGTFTTNAGDKLKFGADGSVTSSQGESQKLFEGDTLVIGPKRVRFDESGAYFDNDQPTKGKVEGAHDAKARRTALAMIAIALVVAAQAQQEQKK